MAILGMAEATLAAESESAKFARMGKSTWSAFSCSALASAADDPKEAKRLFEFGYQEGKRFIAAAQAGKITKEDAAHVVPVGVTWLLEGPSPDFMLGRIFESAQDEALKEVFASGEHFNSDSEKKLIASTRFSSQNCQLIGGAR